MKNLNKIIALTLALLGPVYAPALYAESMSAGIGGGVTLVLPLQEVNVTQLYSLKEGRGFVGAETNLLRKGDAALAFGAATSTSRKLAFPFVGFNIKLPTPMFDTSNNELKFGLFYGRDFNKRRDFYGLKFSAELF